MGIKLTPLNICPTLAAILQVMKKTLFKYNITTTIKYKI